MINLPKTGITVKAFNPEQKDRWVADMGNAIETAKFGDGCPSLSRIKSATNEITSLNRENINDEVIANNQGRMSPIDWLKGVGRKVTMKIKGVNETDIPESEKTDDSDTYESPRHCYSFLPPPIYTSLNASGRRWSLPSIPRESACFLSVPKTRSIYHHEFGCSSSPYINPADDSLLGLLCRKPRRVLNENSRPMTTLSDIKRTRTRSDGLRSRSIANIKEGVKRTLSQIFKRDSSSSKQEGVLEENESALGDQTPSILTRMNFNREEMKK